jgi:hypothetical protein
MPKQTFGFHKMLGGSQVATQPVASQVMLSSLELISQFVCLFVCLFVLFLCLPAYLSVCVPALPVCLYVSQSVGQLWSNTL